MEEWSYGEVTKPETINYRSRKPERDGLFCQRIFGPVKDWQCACGKYKKLRYRGITCDRCGVEITRSLVRRERLGHIKLAAPVAHIWFLRSVPSKIGLLLDMSVAALEKVAYFANFIITHVDEDLKEKAQEKLEQEFNDEKKALKHEKHNDSKEYARRLEDLTTAYKETKREITELYEKRLLTELEYRELSMSYGHIFEAGIGAEAILKLLENLDLSKLARELEKKRGETTNPTKKKKLLQRIKYVHNFITNNVKPEYMVLRAVPVIPPELRPLVPLDGGRFASSDLNDLYRRIINRNNRLKRLYDLHAPEVILRNEKRMLQEAVDALIDNEMRSGKTTIASTGQRRPLKSLADILKGKQGRFRQNLLGKRVDYSGRSVIVVGPRLKLSQCGLPKLMAVELFKPFIASELIKREIVHNVRSANRLIETGTEEVYAILEEIIKDTHVLLNRAPTLHRLGIQAFQPVLIEGKAIQIHPLVCAAFNADFDGDQMAVHVPITSQARDEAKNIILSTHNLLKPATGEPIVTPTQDMIWGAYYMTYCERSEQQGSAKHGSYDERREEQGSAKHGSYIHKKSKKEYPNFSSIDEAVLAYSIGKITLQEKINVRVDSERRQVSVGRLLFNAILPKGIYTMDTVVDKGTLKQIVIKTIQKYGRDKTVELLDQIKQTTLTYLTGSGLSWGMDDLPDLEQKKEILAEAEKRIDEIRNQYETGLLSENERYLKSIEVWISAKDKITEVVRKRDPEFSPIFSMVESGARGSWAQLTQMFGMRGIVSSPTGRLIELPIKSSFKEGFNVLEYFISTHGSRKGVSDTALRTASAGYLTRRMVDVCQDIIITKNDCKSAKGFKFTREDNTKMGENWQTRLFGRVAEKAIHDPKSKAVIVRKNDVISYDKAEEIQNADPEEVRIRSVLTCQSVRGICARCYGYDLSYNEPVKIGTPVGIIAAQSIGEPGTQLTLRTFHTGGVAGKDITQGLPRVEELFEVRPVKRKAVMAKHKGTVKIISSDDQKRVRITYLSRQEDTYTIAGKKAKLNVKQGQKLKKGDSIAILPSLSSRASRGKTKEVSSSGKKITARHSGEVAIEDTVVTVTYEGEKHEEYDVAGYTIWVKDKDKVEKGQQLTDGSLDLRELYTLRGKEEVEKYILREIQYIYSSQGQRLNDKHVELIIRQIFSRVLVVDSGDTDLLPGEIVPKAYVIEANKIVEKEGKKSAKVKELLTGITRVSLSTDSWLSAASFQETSRVLVNAAISGRPDYLRGLKENVIVGQLIPAGTGLESRKA
ncbi:DNA-directed RNA polymerase subunit beta' [Patescibacteria group bacterium AH-259-L05]|nr:DNA-directed RNA polymerase subunit beta' [Patescibacteria group bacterium AH-259-L05]